MNERMNERIDALNILNVVTKRFSEIQFDNKFLKI